MRRVAIAVACAAYAVLADAPARAATQDISQAAVRTMQRQLKELQDTVKTLTATVKSQSEEINNLKKQSKIQPLVSAPYPGPGGPPVPVSTLPPAAPVPTAPPATGMAALNPEVGVVGDVVGNATDNASDRDGANQFSFRELEVVFGGYIDPYSRGDFAFTLGEDESAAIEEAFLTQFNLPAQLKGQVGKFRSKFGKINLIDRNALPSVDEPLIVRDYLGDEGFAHTGIRLQRLIPNPWDAFLEGTVELVNGGDRDRTEGGLFHAGKDKPILNTHLKYYRDLTDSTGLELGGSFMVGPQLRDSSRLATLAGLDLILTHFGSQGRKLVWQTELMNVTQERNNDLSLADLLTPDTDPATLSPLELDAALADLATARKASGRNALGAYTMVNYRFHPKWSAGARAEYFHPLDEILTGSRAWSAAQWITFHQSELAQVRLQYEHTDYGQPFFLTRLDHDKEDQVMLQFRFQIGVDRHGLQ
jgi:hypothetical protein